MFSAALEDERGGTGDAEEASVVRLTFNMDEGVAVKADVVINEDRFFFIIFGVSKMDKISNLKSSSLKSRDFLSFPAAERGGNALELS